MTKTYAVIGDPIDHSLSPSIHNAAFRALGMDCTYIAYRIPRGELREGIDSLRQIKIAGFNVTIPHKVEMIKYLEEASEECKVIGATNTVSNEDGKLVGYNTDMDGFLEPIKKRSIPISGASVLLLGAGGAARAIVAGFAKEGAGKIMIANRTQQRGQELARFASGLGLDVECTTLEQAGKDAGKYRFIVNATAVGLRGEPSPISTKTIGPECIVYDIIYMPMNTDLIAQSKKNSATVIYGYEMLLGQAAIAFEIWHKTKAPYDAMRKALLGGF
ncbi:MAG: shikimate dehydrogenase [Candidatus Nitrosotenuis sp.]|uniref:Shikimate dehydrogenase (NADP(+)) n=1 Tax=Candidatus Nitrosotenuis uzonensis TaxID=1407055 RepID=A0A812F9V3_9ARCH|nr:shikimate dehydrogenase [Candidatus Nitrosotenuis uzonensis]CAE6504427.1 Shikimate dehydrogenase (NADP(+)) [Candidatus Nitrosotenuis uzonensis]